MTTVSALTKWVLVLVAASLSSAAYVLISYSRREHSGRDDSLGDSSSTDLGPSSGSQFCPTTSFPYQSITVTILQEAVKFLIASISLIFHYKYSSGDIGTFSFRKSLLFAVPCAFYVIDNNLQYVILVFLDPATSHLLSNFNIIVTGVLFRIVLRRKLSNIQWAALSILMCALMTAESGKPRTHNALDTEESDEGFNPGYLFVALVAFCSAFANIYNEKILKKDVDDSVHLQNMQMYAYGFIFNIIALLLVPCQREKVMSHGFFHGHDHISFSIVFVQATFGLSVSLLLKFADNIYKIFSGCLSFLLTTLVANFLFDNHPTMHFYLGTAIVILAIYIYNTKPDHTYTQLDELTYDDKDDL